MDTAFWPFLLLVSWCQSIERSKLPLFSQVDYVIYCHNHGQKYPLKSSGLSRPHCCLIAPNSCEAWKWISKPTRALYCNAFNLKSIALEITPAAPFRCSGFPNPSHRTWPLASGHQHFQRKWNFFDIRSLIVADKSFPVKAGYYRDGKNNSRKRKIKNTHRKPQVTKWGPNHLEKRH